MRAKATRPNILAAASNTRQLEWNLSHILDTQGQMAIAQEIRRNVAALFALGEDHLRIAETFRLPIDWRHLVSRSYYSAHNIGRAVRFHKSGTYSTDSSDHKKAGSLPDNFPNSARYSTDLPLLHDDRNIADYDHDATPESLVTSPPDALALAKEFHQHARTYLIDGGVVL